MYTMKLVMGSGCIGQVILNLDARWKRVVKFTFRPP